MSESKDFRLTIRTLPGNWGDILQAFHNEHIMLGELMTHRDANDAFPIPWDGTLWIEDDHVVLLGSAQCGGPPGCGTCRTTYPKSQIDAMMEYAVQVYDGEGGDGITRFRAILDKYMVEYAEEY